MISRWLFAEGSPRRLAAVRIGLCAILALRLTRTVYIKLADQPAALYRPRSFMHLFGSMPPREVVIALQAVALIAAVLAMIGWRARVALPVAWVCALVLGGMTTSLGKVVHNDVLLMLCLVPLLMAPHSEAWALDARARDATEPSVRYGWPVQTAMVVVAGAYFFAGLAKLVNSGAGWVTSGNMRWVLYTSSDARATPNHLALFIADRPWLAHLLAAATLAIELGFPVVLWWKRARPYAVAASIALHTGIWMTMGLDYWPQAAIVAVVLIDWPAVRARAADKTHHIVHLE